MLLLLVLLLLLWLQMRMMPMILLFMLLLFAVATADVVPMMILLEMVFCDATVCGIMCTEQLKAYSSTQGYPCLPVGHPQR